MRRGRFYVCIYMCVYREREEEEEPSSLGAVRIGSLVASRMEWNGMARGQRFQNRSKSDFLPP